MRIRQVLTEGWRIRRLEPDGQDVVALAGEAAGPDETWLPTRMPAQVHDVLLAHGLIPDPRLGRNAAECAWVGDKDWAYTGSFRTPDRSDGPVFLRFGGLDTLAAAWLNGAPIGRFDNMFREWQVDVRDHLAPPGEDNRLLLVFSSPARFVNEVQQPSQHAGKIARHKYLRKAANDFTSYLGARPHFIKVGIYCDIVLDVPERAWIEDVCVRSELSPDQASASVHVDVEAAGVPACLQWAFKDASGEEVARGTVDSCAGGFIVEVDQPQLWWPWTHGRPHLYELDMELVIDGEVLDSRRMSVGVRDVQAVLDDAASGEKRFRFEINGRPIFLQGANWVPVEGMTHCWDAARARQLLALAEHARMNLLRVWGGGYVPPEEFYDECDRRGILVWQDFMFEYGMHPSGEPGFDDNCRAEAEGIVRRLRNHPCILLWCGGNENYMGWDYDIGGEPAIGRDLFEAIIPEVCSQLDPTRLYHRSSPYGGRLPNWPREGDWHDYTWRGFSHESSVPLFISEGGRASAMSLSSMRRFLDEEDLWPEGYDPAIRTPGQPAWPPMWQYRSVDNAWIKVGPIEEFCDPKTSEELIRVLGTAHGEYLRRTVERYRRGVPDGSPDGNRNCGGYMAWRHNDAWPILYYSLVDYYLEPKIPYYFLRRAFAPVLLSFEETTDRLAVWVVNDSIETVAGALTLRRVSFHGDVRGELTMEVEVLPGQSKRCRDTVELGMILYDEVLHAAFADQQATHLLKGERYLRLPRAELRAQAAGAVIDLRTDVFARQIAFEVEAATGFVFEDNYFDMAPGERRTITVVHPADAHAVDDWQVSVRAVNADPIHITLHGA